MLLFAIDTVANAKRCVLTTLTTPLPQEQQVQRVSRLRLAACGVSYTVAGAMEDNDVWFRCMCRVLEGGRW
jgi:hypothetical protein